MLDGCQFNSGLMNIKRVARLWISLVITPLSAAPANAGDGLLLNATITIKASDTDSQPTCPYNIGSGAKAFTGTMTGILGKSPAEADVISGVGLLSGNTTFVCESEYVQICTPPSTTDLVILADLCDCQEVNGPNHIAGGWDLVLSPTFDAGPVTYGLGTMAGVDFQSATPEVLELTLKGAVITNLGISF
ncbi:MAG: hypothetical protein ABSG46_01920 [Candidatus Binataceae bacterium]|jgi:hypothetical protein